MVVGAYNNEFSAFYFNLHADVGPGKPNKQDDVELVRLGIKALRSSRKVQAGGPDAAAFMAASAQVGPMGPYDPSIGAAVKAFQKLAGLTQDGVVSRIVGSFAPSGNSYTLQIMLANMRFLYPNLYPRIDQLAELGPTASTVIKHMFVRVS
jgi:murein L,D-transpeptidase YcbB/YkuD